jgi:tRNA threonylcarbamoyladenosine modification (KEOPS) complex  Pcc1 subunit
MSGLKAASPDINVRAESSSSLKAAVNALFAIRASEIPRPDINVRAESSSSLKAAVNALFAIRASAIL